MEINKNEEKYLHYSGRTANHKLSFREWNKSKHAQYFTPLWLSEIIYNLFVPFVTSDNKDINILDPTCGNGRLLYPFYKEGFNVFGIELDRRVYNYAKNLLDEKNIRNGNIIDYRYYLKNKFDLIVMNPPYGLRLEVDKNTDDDFLYDGVDYDKTIPKIESQFATLQIIEQALKRYGEVYVVMIIPSSTWTNTKDNKFREYYYKHFDTLLKCTFDNLFYNEYKIGVKVDLVIASKKTNNNELHKITNSWQDGNLCIICNEYLKSGESYTNIKSGKRNYRGEHIMDSIHTHCWLKKYNLEQYYDCKKDDIKTIETNLINAFNNMIKAHKLSIYHNYGESEIYRIPKINKLKKVKIENKIELTANGYKGDSTALALLDFYNEVYEDYNIIQGKPTGYRDANFALPCIIRNGVEKAEQELKLLGYEEVFISEATRDRINRLQKKYNKLLIPLYFDEKKDFYKLLAYFDDKEYTAKADVYNANNELLFIKGKKYHIHPTWQREEEVVGEITQKQKKKNGKIVSVSTQQYLDRGYLVFNIITEQGEYDFEEINNKDIEIFLRAFNLPIVKDVAKQYPEKVEYYRKKATNLDCLFDYQIEDVSRMCCKDSIYLGYEMGGGKTLTSIAYAVLRKFKCVLVICTSGLIENWLNEFKKFKSKKFNFDIQRLTTDKELKKVFSINKKNTDKTTFFITSYEFLKLGGSEVYDEWSCERFNKDGDRIHYVSNITNYKCPQCNRKYKNNQKKCPKCNEHKNWSGRYCGTCGYSAYSENGAKNLTGNNNPIFSNLPIQFGRLPELDKDTRKTMIKKPILMSASPLLKLETKLRRKPRYKRLLKVFDCVIVDEAQLAKSKHSLIGQAVRSIKSKAKVILSGTLISGYVTDLFWNLAFLMGYNNPLFPYKYSGVGGPKNFLEEFGSFTYYSEEYGNTLSKGSKQLIPEVSNLTRLWRLLSPVMIRRRTEDMRKLPQKTIKVILLSMNKKQSFLYEEVEEMAEKVIKDELRKASEQGRNANMGVISKWYWALRRVATLPSSLDDDFIEQHGLDIFQIESEKLKAIKKLVKIIKNQNRKVVLFSGLRSMQSAMRNTLLDAGIKTMFINASVTPNKRFSMVDEFNNNGYTALVTGLKILDKGFNITSASVCIITDIEYNPDTLMQAIARLWRTGQQQPVTAYFLLSRGTIETEMYRLNMQKLETQNNILDGRMQEMYKETSNTIALHTNIKQELMESILNRKSRVEEFGEDIIIESIESIELEHKEPEGTVKIENTILNKETDDTFITENISTITKQVKESSLKHKNKQLSLF